MPIDPITDEQLADELAEFAPALPSKIDALVDSHWPVEGDPWRQREALAARQAFKSALTITLQET